MAGLGPMDGLGGLPFRGPAPGMARGSQDSLGSEKLDSHVQTLNLSHAHSSLNWLNCHYVPLSVTNHLFAHKIGGVHCLIEYTTNGILILYLGYLLYEYTSSTAQGGGGSFKNRKPIGEVGCCDSGMAERSH